MNKPLPIPEQNQEQVVDNNQHILNLVDNANLYLQVMQESITKLKQIKQTNLALVLNELPFLHKQSIKQHLQQHDLDLEKIAELHCKLSLMV